MAIEKVGIALTPVSEALDEWKLNRSQRDQAIEELRRLWDEGIASGPSMDGEEVFARLRADFDVKFFNLPKC